MRARLLGLILTLVAAGCGDDGGTVDEPELGGPRDPFPTLVCPGADGCAGTGDGVFQVGAARASITPDLGSYETEFEDMNENGEWDSGEPFTDSNDNGTFDAAWMAGFGNGRPATGVHADVWVRAVVLDWNDLRLAIAVVDSVGWMENEIEQTREMLPASLDIDHLLVSSTHVHEAIDTMGLWGRQELQSGLDPDYQKLVRDKTVEAVTAAVDALEPVTMTYATTETVDESGSAAPFVGDGRDPNILDPTVTIVQFQSVANAGETVATLVHWAAHPEYSGDENNMITPDYVYLVREALENGLPEEPDRGLPAIDGLGGEVVYLQGPLGGQIGPSGTRPVGTDGNEITSSGLDKADAVGRNVGRLALEAITSADDTVDVADPDLEFRTGIIDLAVENTFYHVAGLVGVFDRTFWGHDESKPLGDNNIPYIESRVTYLRIGTLGIITAPGELHPELFVGGYDGSLSYDGPIVHPDNPNPPPLDQAPQGPYLRDIMLAKPEIDHAICVALGEDMIGYIVPSYNYQLDANTPYIEEPDGDHYEETNSVGPLVEEQAVGSMRQLIEWAPDQPAD
jgi:hypothetical protein